MKGAAACSGRRFEPADHCRPAKPTTRPSAQTAARPNSDIGPKMARNRSRRRSVRQFAATHLHCLHVKRKYKRVNRRRRLTVRGRMTVSKASHSTIAMTNPLRRKASRCTDITTSELPSSPGSSLNQMTHDRLALRVAPYSLLELAVASGQTLMLAQMFRPGRHQKCLEVDVGAFEVTVDGPA